MSTYHLSPTLDSGAMARIEDLIYRKGPEMMRCAGGGITSSIYHIRQRRQTENKAPKAKLPTLHPGTVAKVRELAADGAVRRVIATECGLTVEIIAQIAEDNGIVVRTVNKINPARTAKVLELARAGLTAAQIAAQVRVSWHYAKDTAKAHGITLARDRKVYAPREAKA